MTTASRPTVLVAAAAVCLLAGGCTPPDGGRSWGLTEAYLALLAAEDARPHGGPELARLIGATRDGAVLPRRAAVRALGRLERPDLVDEIASLLDDPAPGVRAETANALAQAVHTADGDAVLDVLLARAAVERHPEVRAVLARSIGRSAESPESRARASAALVELSRTPEGGDAPTATLLGVALGLESVVRRADGQGLSREAEARLAQLVRYGSISSNEDAARVRALAVSTLGQAGRLDGMLLERARTDHDVRVRLAAARHVGALAPGQRPETIRRLLQDPETAVTVEAFRAVAREPVGELYCRYLLAGVDPRVEPAIRITALGGLARPCPQAAEQRETLLATVAEVDTASADGWHAPVHALLALTRIAPESARRRLGAFTGHPNPFARAYAAQAAAALGEEPVLRALANDPEPNVRTAALRALFEREGHAIDALLLDQTRSDDPQLLLSVAALLEGSRGGVEAARTLLGAFERISASRRETWRDPRRALLARIAELGDASLADRLMPFLRDYDPLVADDVATILRAWTGQPHHPSPEPLPRGPLPTAEELEALDGARVVLHMRSGGSIEIELLPWLATTNVFRFARLAEEGWFDGLTFHRWATNFVIQGGSPGANEYQGAGAYTRDEVGLEPHWRGTVGISTRGRDTGDAQIFVNLVDNVRLNHDYTIVGRVVEGLDVVDAVLEGGVIERAEVVPGR